MALVNISSLELAFIFQTDINGLNYLMGLNRKSLCLPKGAILSTLLISLLVNNPPSILHHIKILEFVDDVKLFMNIQSILDFVTLQADKKQLVSWGECLGFKRNV